MINEIRDWWKNNQTIRNAALVLLTTAVGLLFARDQLRMAYETIPESDRLPVAAIFLGTISLGLLLRLGVLKWRTSNKSWKSDKT